MNFKKENLSPTAIVKDLQKAVHMLPESDGWSDYFEGGTGRTIIELIAGSQAIKNHYNLMRVRESSLQVAKLDSSVTELAINKGVYRPAAKSYIIEVTFTATSSGFIEKGAIVGSFKEFSVYALEKTEYKFGQSNTINVTVGTSERFEKGTVVSSEYETIDVKSKHKYVSEEFQTLTVNGEVCHIIDEGLNLYDKKLNNSVLRLVYEGFSRLVFGDGIVGRKLEQNDEIVYSYMSFSDKLLDNLEQEKFSLSSLPDVADITNIEVKRKPTKYISKELLRKVAMRNSIDGRWVQVEDYKNGVLREYGEYIDDLLVEDVYPSEEMVILPNKTTWTPGVEDLVRELVDNKRGNATLVNIRYLDPNDLDRLSLSFSFIYQGPETNETIEEITQKYIESKLNKIHYIGYWISGADIAVELTNISDGKFFANLDEKFYIEPLQSVSSMILNFSRS